MAPTLLITRPDPGGAAFAKDARACLRGAARIVHAPVMQFEAAGESPSLEGIKTLVFTSRQGVAQFAARSARRDLAAITVGDGTAAAARDAGLAATSARGDASDLVAHIVQSGAPGPMLHLRGAHAAADVAGALRRAGVDARDAVIYRQLPRRLSVEALECLNGESPVVLPLFSPRSSALLFEQITPRAPLLVLAISQAAADRVPQGIAHDVQVVARPDGATMLAALGDIWARAIRLEGAGGAQ